MTMHSFLVWKVVGTGAGEVAGAEVWSSVARWLGMAAKAETLSKETWRLRSSLRRSGRLGKAIPAGERGSGGAGGGRGEEGEVV